ncbi:MAG: hypothetical protein GQ557_01660 [Mycoplasmataceae bacterium]|nr:hypothetical protein [Mycoplasmataceae bacterium]
MNLLTDQSTLITALFWINMVLLILLVAFLLKILYKKHFQKKSISNFEKVLTTIDLVNKNISINKRVARQPITVVYNQFVANVEKLENPNNLKVKLSDITGVGPKTVIFLKENSINNIEDLVNFNSDDLPSLIKKLPGIKSERIKYKSIKFNSFLDQASDYLINLHD